MRPKTPSPGPEWFGGVLGSKGWRRRVGAAFFVVACCARAAASAPSGNPAHGKKTPPPPAVAAEHPAGYLPEMAVVYDDVYRPPAKDLLLGQDAERKAESNARFMHGLLLEDASGGTDAQTEYLKALSLDPTNARLAVKVAWLYLAQGDTPAAVNLLKETTKAAPKQPQPYLALAYLYFSNLDKPAEAAKYAEQAVAIDPGSIFGYAYLREIYKAQGQEGKVPALLDRAAKADSKDAFFWLQLGALYAEVYLAQDPGKDGDALRKTTQVFQKALSFGGDDVDIIEKIADFFVATQQIAEAAPLYQRVVDIDPARNAARDSLARCYIALKQPDKAATALEDSIKQNPVQPHAYEALAEIYKDAGQEEKAIRNYEQSLLLNPGDVRGYEDLAKMLLRRSQAEHAVKVLTEARRRFPDLPGFTYLLGVALEENKQHQQALATMEQAEVDAQSTQPTMLDSQFYFEFGRVADQAGLQDKAADMFQKSLGLEDDPRMIAQTSNYLGYMWVEHDQHLDEGGDFIKKALEIDPDNGAYLDSLGWYYYKKNQFPQALEQLQRAVEKTQPADATVLEHLGDIYLKLNDTAKAVDAWKQALELDPQNPNVPALNKKIADTKAAAQAAPTPGPSAPPKS